MAIVDISGPITSGMWHYGRPYLDLPVPPVTVEQIDFPEPLRGALVMDYIQMSSQTGTYLETARHVFAAGREDDGDPAELRVNYEFAHPDYNGDGEVDGDDDDFEFGWWRQEMPGQGWEKIASARVHDLTEVRAEIDGFTRYALAGGT